MLVSWTDQQKHCRNVIHKLLWSMGYVQCLERSSFLVSGAWLGHMRLSTKAHWLLFGILLKLMISPCPQDGFCHRQHRLSRLFRTTQAERTEVAAHLSRMPLKGVCWLISVLTQSTGGLDKRSFDPLDSLDSFQTPGSWLVIESWKLSATQVRMRYFESFRNSRWLI